jgi:tRNA(Ile)-lysidine synthase
MRATLAIRQAVRPWVEAADARILLGVSGGADSLALAIATYLECKSANIEVVAIIIDHQLQRFLDPYQRSPQTLALDP